MLTRQELRELLGRGENSSVEFKSEDVRPEALAKEIGAFANSDGGIILLGVDDSGKVEGLTRKKDYEEWVMNISRNNVSPAISADFSKIEIEGKTIAVITVPKGKDKPYQIGDKYYIRVGTTNRTATQGELLRLFQAAGVFHYDRTGVPGTSVRNLNLSEIDQYFLRYDIDFSSESADQQHSVLTNSEILAETGEATVAGLLIFGINPTRYLPQCGISFAHFADTDISGDLFDKQNIEGTLGFQADTSLAVIKHNLAMPSEIVGTKRCDTRVIPPDKAIRELIVNACVHRNYSIAGSRIRILMFADRIEFSSPGRLPNTVTIEKLKIGVSHAVNPVIVKFMDNLRYMDRLGRGLPMVWKEMKKIGGSAEFREIGEEFKVILHLPKS